MVFNEHIDASHVKNVGKCLPFKRTGHGNAFNSKKIRESRSQQEQETHSC